MFRNLVRHADRVAILNGQVNSSGQVQIQGRAEGFLTLDPQGYTIIRGDNPTEYQRTGRNVRVFGFERHPVAHTCARVICDIAGTVPFEAYQTSGQGGSANPKHGEVNILSDHDALTLLNRPRVLMNSLRLRTLTFLHELLYGNSFWLFERKNPLDPTSEIRSVRLLHPEWIQYVYLDPDTLEVMWFRWRDRVGRSHLSTCYDILHWRDLSGGDFLFGYPRAAAALLAIASDDEATQYVRQMVTNHGSPGVIIRVPAVVDDAELNSRAERFREKWTKRGGRGGTMFLRDVDEVIQVGFNLRDLEFDGLRSVARQDIATAFNVDPLLIGAGVARAKGGSSMKGEQYKEARVRLVNHTVLPLMKAQEAELDDWFMPEFKPLAKLRYSSAALADMTEDKQETSTRIIGEWEAGLRTREEGRVVLELDDKPSADDNWFIPSSGSIVNVADQEDLQAVEVEQKKNPPLPPTLGPNGQPVPGTPKPQPGLPTGSTKSSSGDDAKKLPPGKKKTSNLAGRGDSGSVGLIKERAGPDDEPRDDHGRWTDGGELGGPGRLVVDGGVDNAGTALVIPKAEAEKAVRDNLTPATGGDAGKELFNNPIPQVTKEEYLSALHQRDKDSGKLLGFVDNPTGDVANVPISKLVSPQELVSGPSVVKKMTGSANWSSSELPVVVKHGDKFMVIDGNHRLVAAMLAGEKTAKVQIAGSRTALPPGDFYGKVGRAYDPDGPLGARAQARARAATKYLYHGTTLENLKDIRKQGLLPVSGATWFAQQESMAKMFGSKKSIEQSSGDGPVAGKDNPVVVLRTPLTKDFEYGGSNGLFYTTAKRIPAAKIEVQNKNGGYSKLTPSGGEWVTINGVHVLIGRAASEDDVVVRVIDNVDVFNAAQADHPSPLPMTLPLDDRPDVANRASRFSRTYGPMAKPVRVGLWSDFDTRATGSEKPYKEAALAQFAHERTEIKAVFAKDFGAARTAETRAWMVRQDRDVIGKYTFDLKDGQTRVPLPIGSGRDIQDAFMRLADAKTSQRPRSGEVSIKGLTATQGGIAPSKQAALALHPAVLAAPVTLGTMNGKTYVMDGHHRLSALIQNGALTVPATIYDLDIVGQNTILTNAPAARAAGDDPTDPNDVDDPYIKAALQKITDDYGPEGDYHRAWLERYRALIGDTFSAAGQDVAAQGGFDFRLQSPYVQKTIQKRATKLAEFVTKATADQITALSSTAREQGMGIKQLADMIDQTVFGDQAPVRSERIARTESIGALNEGEYTAATDSGVFNYKEWLTQGDDRVRDAHDEHEGEGAVDINYEFAPGLLHPGDQTADADETVNCRCSLLYYVDKADAARASEDEMGHRYSEDEPRDNHGRWAGDGGSAPLPPTQAGDTLSYGARRPDTPDSPVDSFQRDLGLYDRQITHNTSWTYMPTEKGEATVDINVLRYGDATERGQVELHWLIAEQRGAGRAAMERIVTAADRNNVTINAWAYPLARPETNPGPMMTRPALEKFYRGFGFQTVKRDDEGFAYMRRLPKTSGRADHRYSEDQLRDDHGRWTDGGTAVDQMISKPSSAYPVANPDSSDTLERHTTADGKLTPERAALHEEIADRAFRGNTPVAHPEVQFTGGGPAAGKSTSARGLDVSNHVIINPDNNRALLPEYREGIKAGDTLIARNTHNEASQISADMATRAQQGSYNALVDGTGDKSYDHLTEKVNGWRQAGYRVNADYTVVDEDVAMQRMLSRAQRTGRYVPEGLLRQTHRNIATILPQAAHDGLFDHLNVWDNNGAGPVKIASAVGSKLTIHDQGAWDRFLGGGRLHGRAAADEDPSVEHMEAIVFALLNGEDVPDSQLRDKLAADIQDIQDQGGVVDLPFDFAAPPVDGPIVRAFKEIGRRALHRYSDDEARDQSGKWTDGSGGGELHGELYGSAAATHLGDDQAGVYRLNDDEQYAFESYRMGGGFQVLLNARLRGIATPEMEKNFQQYRAFPAESQDKAVATMDGLIEKAPALDKPVVVFRGIPGDSPIHGHATMPEVGKTFVDRGFVSTTVNPTQAEQWMGQLNFEHKGKDVLLKIHVPAGAKALWAPAIDTSDSVAVKNELILPRGAKFTVRAKSPGVVELDYRP